MVAGVDGDGEVLRRRVRRHAEQEHVAGFRPCVRPGDHMAVERRPQLLGLAGRGPVRRIGRNPFGLAAMKTTPDAAHETEAIATDALERGLMAVGRADERARSGHDQGGIDGPGHRDRLPPSLRPPART